MKLRASCSWLLPAPPQRPLSGIVTPANAQNYPNREVKLVVGFPAGGGTDVMTRVTAEYMAARLGQRVIVENRPGASTALATRAVLQAPPDGYTLLFGNQSIAANLHGMKEPGYKLDDFVLIGSVSYSPLMLVVNTASSGAKSLEEFVAVLENAHPGKLTLASDGPTTVQNVMAGRLQAASGMTGLQVPYKGGAQVMPDLTSGTVDAFFGRCQAHGYNLMGRPNMAVLAVSERQAAQKIFPTCRPSRKKAIR